MSCWHWNRVRVRCPGDVPCSLFSQSPGARCRQIHQSNPTHCLAGKARAESLAVAFPQQLS